MQGVEERPFFRDVRTGREALNAMEDSGLRGLDFCASQLRVVLVDRLSQRFLPQGRGVLLLHGFHPENLARAYARGGRTSLPSIRYSRMSNF